MFTYLLIIILQTFTVFVPQSTLAQGNSLETLNTGDFSFFRKSPRLSRAVTTYTLRNVLSSYIFEIEIPLEAKNNLTRVIINQQKNVETIKLFPNKTRAFIINGREEEIPVNVTLNRSNNLNELTINLVQPVSSGEKVRIKVRAINPIYGGIYQFGVTVFPEGNNPRSLYLGIGRFHFDQHGGRY